MFTMQDICFLCLKDKKNLFVLNKINCGENGFLKAALRGKRSDNLYELLKTIIPEQMLEVPVDNESWICSDCYIFINKIHTFRELCMKNIQVFSMYLEKLQKDNNVKGNLSIELMRYDVNLDPTDFLDFKIETSSDTELDEATNEVQNEPKASEDSENPFTCVFCRLGFPDQTTLYKHQKTHNRTIECHQCGMTFTKRANYKKHIFIHTGQKPFSCDICKKQFNRKSNLNCHKLIHTGARPHECEICKKTFRTVSALSVHKRMHTGEKPFVCEFCDKTYAHKDSLRQHRKTHTGEKHVCNVCGEIFEEFWHLRKHRETHRVQCKSCSEFYLDTDTHRCVENDNDMSF